MIAKLGWSFWAIAPALALAFHFGPGQKMLKRDVAADRFAAARVQDKAASKLQQLAYEAQFKTIEARRKLLIEDNDANRIGVERALQEEQAAYTAASDAWKNVADQYQEIATLLDGTSQAKQVKWLQGRALVRSGEVFNGMEVLESALSEALDDGESGSELALVTRQELAAAHYFGARLLREEGRASDLWRQVSESSRQQYRFLAEQTSKERNPELASNFQKNVERVLDLEQSDRSEFIARPIPKDSPRGLRPGDGVPGKRPGRGPRQGERPGNGASQLLEIGPGW